MTIIFKGYAIVSADGFIADDSGRMPKALCFEADWAHFRRALDQADIMLLGRHTHELSPSVTNRRRLVASRGVRAVIQENSSTWWVNPEEVTPASAVAVVIGTEAKVAVAGGKGVYDWILDEGGYDVFELSVARNVKLGSGRPLFDSIGSLNEIIGRLGAKGLTLCERSWLNQTAKLELLTFKPEVRD